MQIAGRVPACAFVFQKWLAVLLKYYYSKYSFLQELIPCFIFSVVSAARHRRKPVSDYSDGSEEKRFET
jgi:hypothetical protein